jgi:hypothetical protein
LHDGQTGVYVPIHYSEDFALMSSWTFLTLNQLSYALIFEEEKGKKSLEVVTTFPDSSYLMADSLPKYFSGVVLVEDWNGKRKKTIVHSNGNRQMKEESTVRLKQFEYCETVTDWYTCSSIDGGSTWNCRYDYTEVTFGLCGGNGGGGTPCSTCFDYEPSTGSNPGNYEVNPPDEDNFIEDCGVGYTLNHKGECVKLIEPCGTGDPILDNANIQAGFNTTWAASNAFDSKAPMGDRLEQGGWIVLSNGVYSFVPFPNTWIRTPCGIDPPANWTNDIPNNLVGVVHSHPFYSGEDTRSVCGEDFGVSSYGTGMDTFLINIDDENFLKAISGAVGNQLTGYIIDGIRIRSYKIAGDKMETKPFNRCGY